MKINFDREERDALEKVKLAVGISVASFVHDATVTRLRSLGLLPQLPQPEEFI